jgi:hypothetical protein
MIIISAGLQKAGSGLYFNLVNDLLIASGGDDAREIKRAYQLDDILQHHNCNIGDLRWAQIKKLLLPHLQGKRFVVKTHSKPTFVVKLLIVLGIVKALCIYRDPRDVVLSALDHGQKIRARGEQHTFASCLTVDNTIPQVKHWLGDTIRWMELKDVLTVRYEDLLAEPVAELQRLAAFIGIDCAAAGIDPAALLSRYQGQQLDSSMKDYLHWNRGVAGRYQNSMPQAEQRRCDEQFAPYLKRLGYPLITAG